MWRAIIMAAGLCLLILGGEAMVIDRVILADGRTIDDVHDLHTAALDSPYGTTYDNLTHYASSSAYPIHSMHQRIVVPPDWAPWALMSAGVLTFLYASALPTRE